MQVNKLSGRYKCCNQGTVAMEVQGGDVNYKRDSRKAGIRLDSSWVFKLPSQLLTDKCRKEGDFQQRIAFSKGMR